MLKLQGSVITDRILVALPLLLPTNTTTNHNEGLDADFEELHVWEISLGLLSWILGNP